MFSYEILLLLRLFLTQLACVQGPSNGQSTGILSMAANENEAKTSFKEKPLPIFSVNDEEHVEERADDLEDMASKSKPQDMASKSKPQDMASKSKPQDMASKSKPQDMASKSKPQDMASKSKPQDMASKSKPQNMASKSKPQDMASKSKPQDMASKSKPQDMASKSKPQDNGGDDLFSCHPCSCSHTPSGRKIANCISRGLHDLPLTLPPDIAAIKMSSNRLKTFHASSISIYPNLTTLDLTHNKIEKVLGHVTQNITSRLTYLTLNKNRIKLIEHDSLCVFPNLHELRLFDNKLIRIEKTMFKCTHKLRVLDVSKNDIRHIDAEAFDSLGMMQLLNLRSNANLGYFPKHFSPRIAQNLTGLHSLHIQGNFNGAESYPNDLLGKLINLKELSIDGLKDPLQLGPQLKKLTNLTKLHFGPWAICNFHNISSTFFQHTPYLTSLSFCNCNFVNIDPRALTLIPYLEEYTLKRITTVYYDLDKAFQALKLINTHNSSLKALTFAHVHHSNFHCKTLSADQGQFINNLKLKALNLADNRIVMLQNDFLRCLPNTLESLNLAHNRLDLHGNLWERIPFLTCLQELYLGSQNIKEKYIMHCADEYRLSSVLKQQSEEDVNEETPYIHQQNTSELLYSTEDSYFRFDIPEVGRQRCEENKYIHFEKTLLESGYTKGKRPLPPSLWRVHAPKYLFFGRIVLSKKYAAENLQYLNFSNSFLTDWGLGTIPSNVKVLDLSHNHCSNLVPRCFENVNELRHLSIQNNILGIAFARDRKGYIFSPLDKLQFLDISANMIFKLPLNIFRGLKSIRTLVIQENKLQVLDVLLSHMEQLEYIDASKNSISWISRKTRDDLDILANRAKSKFTLDLTQNPLPCTCDGQEILRWIAESKVFFANQDFLKCRFSNGTLGSLAVADVASMIRNLAEDCAVPSQGHGTAIASVVSGLCGLVIALLLCAFRYRKRWRLLYSINSGFLDKCSGFKPKNFDRSRYKFDAYFVYSEKDGEFVLRGLLEEMEQKRGHKVCVDDRDFLPGTCKISNISSAVQNSVVTVLVLSKSFLEENEFDYVVMSALLEEYYSQDKREVCHLLLYDQLSTFDLPIDLQMLMMKNRFIAYPPMDDGDVMVDVYKKFWDRLSLIIGHSNHTDSTQMLPST